MPSRLWVKGTFITIYNKKKLFSDNKPKIEHGFIHHSHTGMDKNKRVKVLCFIQQSFRVSCNSP